VGSVVEVVMMMMVLRRESGGRLLGLVVTIRVK